MKEQFWQILCDSLPFFSLLFTANVVFLVLLGLSWAFTTPTAETTYVSVLALGPIIVSLLLSIYIIRRCRA